MFSRPRPLLCKAVYSSTRMCRCGTLTGDSKRQLANTPMCHALSMRCANATMRCAKCNKTMLRLNDAIMQSPMRRRDGALVTTAEPSSIPLLHRLASRRKLWSPRAKFRLAVLKLSNELLRPVQLFDKDFPEIIIEVRGWA